MMTEAIKTSYDTLTMGLHRVPVVRDAEYYLQKWRRRHGLLARPGGGKIEKFRRISRFQGLTVEDIIEDRLPRVATSEYHHYRWEVGKLLCVYCNDELTAENRTQDHVIPRSEIRRRLETGHEIDDLLGQANLEPACVDCNSTKGDQKLLVFLATR
jgi:5-methylcytosine-specific restriction endonuclease McrA